LPELNACIIFRLQLAGVIMEEAWSEIKSTEDLEGFLEGKPAEWAQVIATRAALRAFPIALGAVDRAPKETFRVHKSYLLSAFRASFIAWAASQYSQKDLALAGEMAAKRASHFAAEIRNMSGSAQLAYAADAAAAAADAFGGKQDTVRHAYASATLAFLNSRPSMGREASLMERRAVDADCLELASSGVGRLSGMPLWVLDVRGSSAYVANLPLWARAPFDTFAASNLVTNGPWGVIVSWYRAILPNGLNIVPKSSFGKDVDLYLANRPERFWARDPDLVMREIGMIVQSGPEADFSQGQEVRAETIQEIARSIPNQVPAAFRFSAADGPIDAVPALPVTQQQAFARTTLTEAREKAHELLARLEATNASQRVKRTVARVITVLPVELDALNPALLRSRTRSLEADAYAFAAAGAEAELFPEAVSELLDLTATIKDLQGCFSMIAAVERQSAEISVAGREAEAEEALARIGDSAQELATDHPELVTQSAADAVNSLKADIADAPDAKIKARLIADASLTQSNFLAAAYGKVLSPTGREMIRVSGKMYHAAVDGTADGVRYVATKGPLLALAYYLGGPLLAMAAIFANLKPLKDAQLAIEQQSKREASEKPDSDSDGSAHPGD
jgi:hypothetical protein